MRSINRFASDAIRNARFICPLPEADMNEIDFVLDDPAEAATRITTELTGWELVVFEVADEEVSGE